MGMFDPKKYLTGDNGEFNQGDTFTVLTAELVGEVVVNGSKRTEAKLTVQRDGEQAFTVYTSGKGIVGAVERMEPGDLPAKVKLDTQETKNGKMHILIKS